MITTALPLFRQKLKLASIQTYRESYPNQNGLDEWVYDLSPWQYPADKKVAIRAITVTLNPFDSGIPSLYVVIPPKPKAFPLELAQTHFECVVKQVPNIEPVRCLWYVGTQLLRGPTIPWTLNESPHSHSVEEGFNIAPPGVAFASKSNVGAEGGPSPGSQKQKLIRTLTASDASDEFITESVMRDLDDMLKGYEFPIQR